MNEEIKEIEWPKENINMRLVIVKLKEEIDLFQFLIVCLNYRQDIKGVSYEE